jgi:hypothetical protein
VLVKLVWLAFLAFFGLSAFAQDPVYRGVNAVVPPVGPVHSLALWQERGLKAVIGDGSGETAEALAREGVLRIVDTVRGDFLQLPHLLEYIFVQKEMIGGEYGLSPVSYGTPALIPKNADIRPVANILHDLRVLIDSDYWNRMDSMEQAGVYVQLALSLSNEPRRNEDLQDLNYYRQLTGIALATLTPAELQQSRRSFWKPIGEFPKVDERPKLLSKTIPNAFTLKGTVRGTFYFSAKSGGHEKARELALLDFIKACDEWKLRILNSALKGETNYLQASCGEPKLTDMGEFTSGLHGYQAGSVSLVFLQTKQPATVIHDTIRGNYTNLPSADRTFNAAKSHADYAGVWEKEMTGLFKNALYLSSGARERKSWEMEAAYGGTFLQRVARSVQYFSVGTVLILDDPHEAIVITSSFYNAISGTAPWPLSSVGPGEITGCMENAESQWRAACDQWLAKEKAKSPATFVYATCEANGDRSSRKRSEVDNYSFGYSSESLIFSSTGTVYHKAPRS